MIAVISGLGETNVSAANGLNDLQTALQDACPKWRVVRYAYTSPISIDDFLTDALEPPLLFGHSFGGCTATKFCDRYAQQIADAGRRAFWKNWKGGPDDEPPTDEQLSAAERFAALRLYDPVWWEQGNPVAQLWHRTHDTPRCVWTQWNYLKPFGAPLNFQVVPDDGANYKNIEVAGTDHNTVVAEQWVRSESVIFARDQYRRWLAGMNPQDSLQSVTRIERVS